MRILLFAIYILVVVAMAAATFVEKFSGSEIAARWVYGAPWFVALWGVLTVLGVVWLLRRVRRWPVVLLHAAFVVVLVGAALTHFTGRRGYLYLRQGEASSTFVSTETDGDHTAPLPFTVRLDRFDVAYHDGTTTPADYSSLLTINADGHERQVRVSMNNIHSQRGVRLYQGNYDRDMRGSVLAVNIDPWGIPVTYAGYALLFIAFVATLLDPKGGFRRTVRALSRAPQRGVGGAFLALSFFIFNALPTHSAPTLDRATAERFGQLYIVHNGRVCPLQTFAIDFTKKIYGSASYRGYSAEQVLAGMLFWPDDWAGEEVFRVRGGELRGRLHWPRFVSMQRLFNRDMGGYVLRPYVENYYSGHRDKFHREAVELDDAVFLVLETRAGTLLNLYPQAVDGGVQWFGYDPHRKYPAAMRASTVDFMRRSMGRLQRAAEARDMAAFAAAVDEIDRWQRANGGTSLPSEAQVAAERAYNAASWPTILFMVCLSVGLLSLVFAIIAVAVSPATAVRMARWRRVVGVTSAATLTASFAALTVALGLRWVAAGRVPLSNGYETMLFVAWSVMLIALVLLAAWRVRGDGGGSVVAVRGWIAPLSLLMAGFFLLVSHISLMDPNIGSVTPVLNSPLLTVHVSVIMMAFAMLSLVFVCGLVGLIVHRLRPANGSSAMPSANDCPSATSVSVNANGPAPTPSMQLALMGQAMLYPALALLAGGIFIGAVWANVSWGRYWSWDAKETWALVTLMVYAIGAHRATLPSLRRPLCWHIFAVAAFATLAMTYFGVNYLLGSGLHSYA